MSDIRELTEQINKFRDERDWRKFNNHKDVALSLILEAAEILEHFQWKSPEEVLEHVKTHRDKVGEEIADVAIYLLELASDIDIDLADAVEKKLEKNAIKYPIEKARGKHTNKYDYHGKL